MTELKQALLEELCSLSYVQVNRDSSLADALSLRVDGQRPSNSVVKKAMGSLVNAGKVIRNRPEPEGITDDDRPITYWPSSSPVPKHVLKRRVTLGRP